jgi:uncharacterized protein (TIGR00266 family)
MNESIDGGLPDFTDTDHAGIAHRILGTTMPVLEVRLEPGQKVIANGGELSWLDTSIQMNTTTQGAGASGIGGVFKRMVSGSTLFMTEYSAPQATGKVAFAAKMPGHIRPISIDATKEWLVSRHGFLAATPNVVLQPALQQSLGVGIFSGNGFVMQRLSGQGTAWVELSGETVTYDLAAGEQILVHPGHIGLFEGTVSLNITQVKGIKNMIFGADSIFLGQLTGPGKVYLQTLTLPALAHAIAGYLPQNEVTTNPGLNGALRLGKTLLS